MTDSKEPVTQTKKQEPKIPIDSILKLLEELEDRCSQLEITLKDTVTFDTLAISYGISDIRESNIQLQKPL